MLGVVIEFALKSRRFLATLPCCVGIGFALSCTSSAIVVHGLRPYSTLTIK